MRMFIAMLLVAAMFTTVTVAKIRGGGWSSDESESSASSSSWNKSDGYMNPYSRHGSRYSNNSWSNPYATQAPRLYDYRGNYRGRWSANRYDYDSTSNPYGRYGSRYSPDSINNPYGVGSRYSTRPIYVQPGR